MKKFFSLVTALIMAISLVGILPSVAASAETSGDYEYTVLEDGTVEITGYTGSETEIEIPSEIDGKAVTSIGEGAFARCSILTNIKIPDGVTSIGEAAFLYCENLIEINVDSNNTNYSSENGVLFNYNKTELIQYPIGKTQATYMIPNSVKSIWDNAFWGCGSLTSVTIPNSVANIGESAFYDCDSLSSVTIGNSVTSIEVGAFEGCESLTIITIPNSVISIGDYAFYYCNSLTSVTIGNSVTSIGDSAFEDCESLTSITIPNSVISIGDYAFEDCKSLTSITISDSVKSIGDEAFFGCGRLTSVTIPKNVTDIGYDAFGFYLNLYWDNDSIFEIEEIVKFNNFKIYCYAGTAGEQYAKDNGFNYELLDGSNTPNNPNNNSTKPNKTVSQTSNKKTTPSTNKVTVTKPATVKSIKLTTKKKKMNVSWKKVSGATGYEVMYATNNKFTKNKKTVTVKKNKVTLKRLKSKKKYFVKVRAYKLANGNKYFGKWSKVVKKKVK